MVLVWFELLTVRLLEVVKVMIVPDANVILAMKNLNRNKSDSL